MLSWIQYHVLIELTRHGQCRYSELRPKDVDGNLFTYHLNGLLKDDFIEKADRTYRLTQKGLQFAGTLSLETGRTRQQPKILNAIVCKNDKNEYLFVRWHRQPNIDLVSFPHGMMHYGQKAKDMAAAELAEKAGLEADLTYRGDIYIRGFHSDKIDRHMLVHLFEAHNFRAGREKELRPEVSESFWSPLDRIPRSEFVPGFYELAITAEKHPTGAIFEDIDVAL